MRSLTCPNSSLRLLPSAIVNSLSSRGSTPSLLSFPSGKHGVYCSRVHQRRNRLKRAVLDVADQNVRLEYPHGNALLYPTLGAPGSVCCNISKVCAGCQRPSGVGRPAAVIPVPARGEPVEPFERGHCPTQLLDSRSSGGKDDSAPFARRGGSRTAPTFAITIRDGHGNWPAHTPLSPSDRIAPPS